MGQSLPHCCAEGTAETTIEVTHCQPGDYPVELYQEQLQRGALEEAQRQYHEQMAKEYQVALMHQMALSQQQAYGQGFGVPGGGRPPPYGALPPPQPPFGLPPAVQQAAHGHGFGAAPGPWGAVPVAACTALGAAPAPQQLGSVPPVQAPMPAPPQPQPQPAAAAGGGSPQAWQGRGAALAPTMVLNDPAATAPALLPPPWAPQDLRPGGGGVPHTCPGLPSGGATPRHPPRLSPPATPLQDRNPASPVVAPRADHSASQTQFVTLPMVMFDD